MSKEGGSRFSFGKKKETNEGSNEANEMIGALKGASHEEWRVSRILKKNEDGTVEYNPRPKPVNQEADASWIQDNQEKIASRMDAEGKEELITDITKLSFDELPPSHKADTIASVTYAVESLLRAIKNGVPLDDSFIESVSDTIHEQWIVRNRGRVESEIKTLKEKDASGHAALIAERENQLLPYKDLANEQQRDYDRVYIRNAIAEYKNRHPEA